ncbi:hypothetical protein [Bradyrhizobium sp. AUGA SZCCT0160]|uniref:hypothetical protein n=1 Tax=Bradyrhizobium sp. AUGA SZCCT0160 TaxID=2807662 RepID=UPI001BA6C21E|nr:hypothetical protein [Bradyrhizobium sp. AUGA SZCCT0160]MBR1190075.1 hypothetical protein [Bradyrhizobium sp. AUGA SZCCT0160]
MHSSIKRALELIERVEQSEQELAVRRATRDIDEPDALEAWRALMPAPAKKARRELSTADVTRFTASEIATLDATIRQHIEARLQAFAEIIAEEIARKDADDPASPVRLVSNG